MAKRHVEGDLLTVEMAKSPTQCKLCNAADKCVALTCEDGEKKSLCIRRKEDQKIHGGRSPISLKRPMAMTLPRLCLPAIIGKHRQVSIQYYINILFRQQVSAKTIINKY